MTHFGSFKHKTTILLKAGVILSNTVSMTSGKRKWIAILENSTYTLIHCGLSEHTVFNKVVNYLTQQAVPSPRS